MLTAMFQENTNLLMDSVRRRWLLTACWFVSGRSSWSIERVDNPREEEEQIDSMLKSNTALL